MEVKKLYGLIIKDDKRYDYTQKYLEKNGFIIQNKYDKKIKFILFPFKENIDNIIYDKKFFSNLSKDTLIFSGIENKYIKLMSNENNLNYEPIMNSDYVAILNAVPTAEGVISYLIQNRKKTIMDSKILVIGYGRCGKVLAQKLALLGAKVYTNTLNQSDYAKAITNKIIPFYEMNFWNNDFDIIINTACAQTIDNKNLEYISDKTLLIDITPVGFEIEAARKKNPYSNRLLAIPSKFALQSAGEILGKYIYERVIECLPTKKLDSV